MERRGRIIRITWAACLVLAGLNHACILLQHGLFWDYNGAALASAAYWLSLTVIDPLVAALLFLRPTIGVPATAFVITANVVHNLAVTSAYVPDGALFRFVLASPQLLAQIGFMLFVMATWATAWRDVRTGQRTAREGA
ncbi:hypothetical protein [Sphingomonas prati]|uniref:Uncharacterized protein n=1 Tax=Sphingomonas prati TaxID=1843237 RepID=A0A7W9F351_9SPHN|nr:hypothetical protein [Sphingomonas prati]MBB5729484.1 hypothetical protein [Sphingomonas prati]GGE77047.1 hypothetical protein GCM10011404_07200 [Sphingomonas prati]